MMFSPDGNYVYYVTYDGTGSGVAKLYKIAALGGTSAVVLEDIDSAVSFSPDGNRIAFVRGDPVRRNGSIVLWQTRTAAVRTC